MIDSTEAGKFSVTIIYCITLQEILDYFYGQEILNIYHWQMIIVRLYRDNHQSQAVIDYTAAGDLELEEHTQSGRHKLHCCR
jgi:hypothetical protein